MAADPRRLPEWAAGLTGAEVTPSEQPGVWVTESPMGRALARFTGGDDPGVLDHEVTLPDGSTTLNRFRASSCAGGTELVFLVEPLPAPRRTTTRGTSPWCARISSGCGSCWRAEILPEGSTPRGPQGIRQNIPAETSCRSWNP